MDSLSHNRHANFSHPLFSKAIVFALLLFAGLMFASACAAGGDDPAPSDIDPELTPDANGTVSPPAPESNINLPDDELATLPAPEVLLQEIIVTRIVEYAIPTSIPIAQQVDPVVLDVGMVGATPDTLDPQNGDEPNELDLIANLFVGLTKFNQLTGQIEGQLAHSWEVSNDGRTWTFKLRDDIYWVEPRLENSLLNILPVTVGGTIVEPIRPVFAEDVVFAVWRACDPNNLENDVFPLYIITGCREVNTLDVVSEIDFARIGVRAIDSQTVQFDLEQPAAYFLTITALPVMKPVPIEVVNDPNLSPFNDWSMPENSIYITSGPYILSPISIMGSRLVLEPNPYWPLPRTGNAELINVYQFEESLDAHDLWKDRDLDLIPLPPSLKSELFATSASKLMQVSEAAIFYLAYNHESELFQVPELRRAFSAAINREEIIERVYNDYGIPARHLSPPGVFGAPPADRVGVGYDPDFARQQLLAGGITACRFIPEIRYMVNSSDSALFQAELVREMWEDELGCPEEKILIEQVQFGELLANTRSDANDLRPDIWDLGWSGYYPDAHNWLGELLHCTESDLRLKRPCAPVDDSVLRASLARENERPRLYAEIENELFGETGLYPVAPIYTRVDYLLRQTWIDVVDNPIENQLFHFYRLDFDVFLVDPELKRIEQAQ